MKSRPLGKDEVLLLLEHICQHKIITSKATNATNNKLKEDAWKSIAKEFCAMTGEVRRPEQLRLKWENLKKAARKRSALIRQNNLKTGGGKTYIPPDEALDRVASMLGATCTGFIIEFGGDGEGEELPSTSEVVLEVQDMQPLPELPQAEESILLSGDGIGECGGGNGVGVNDIEANFKSKKFIFNTPKSSSNRNRRQKLSEELQRAQKDKELAMAAYFRAKAEKVELENLKLRLEIEQLKKVCSVNEN